MSLLTEDRLLAVPTTFKGEDAQMEIEALLSDHGDEREGKTFIDTNVFKGERLANESIFYIETHFKSTETFLYTHFSSCHPLLSAKKKGRST